MKDNLQNKLIKEADLAVKKYLEEKDAEYKSSFEDDNTPVQDNMELRARILKNKLREMGTEANRTVDHIMDEVEASLEAKSQQIKEEYEVSMKDLKDKQLKQKQEREQKTRKTIIQTIRRLNAVGFWMIQISLVLGIIFKIIRIAFRPTSGFWFEISKYNQGLNLNSELGIVGSLIMICSMGYAIIKYSKAERMESMRFLGIKGIIFSFANIFLYIAISMYLSFAY